MKVLFIGGTGVISSACSREAIERGVDLYLLNRGVSSRPIPDEVKVLRADVRDRESVRMALGDHEFDAVVNWIGYVPEHIENDIETFRGRCGQYVFISSASVYQTPPASLPVTEKTPADNPFWKYSQDKIACEVRALHAYEQEQFPVTIVRPSHTYDRSNFPMRGRYTVIDRMRRGKKIIVHGDGTSLWVLTHNADFAGGFVPLLGSKDAIGEIFHITTDHLLTWNQIYNLAAEAAGTTANIVHIPSEIIAKYDFEWGCDLLGDKAYSMIFDNSKIKRFVPEFAAPIPFSEGVREIVEWHDATPSRQVVDPVFNDLSDRIIQDWETAFGR